MKKLLAGLFMIGFAGLAFAQSSNRYPTCTQVYVCGPVHCTWVPVCK